jgi:hypothetical protein
MGTMVGLLMVLAAAAIAAALGFARRAARLRRQYQWVDDVEEEGRRLRAQAQRDAIRTRNDAADEAARARADAARARADVEHELAAVRAELTTELARRAELADAYAGVKATFDRLAGEVWSLEENLEDISYGLYRPHYSFDTPEEFKTELMRVRTRQADMARGGVATAAISVRIADDPAQQHDEAASADATTAVTTGAAGGAAGAGGPPALIGGAATKLIARLALRAFNGESDAAVAKVTWNNIERMEYRIRTAFDAINQLLAGLGVAVSPKYRDLKLAELRLEHELAERKREIAEEQRRVRDQLEADAQRQRDAEEARAEAEAYEARFVRALETARTELAHAGGDDFHRVRRVAELERMRAEAHTRTVRARAIAERTRAGYLYIVSNIGAFGEGVVKIGMTRRLDPLDEIRELEATGAVPFGFDVHALAYSDDAPALVRRFHQRFRDRSVNLVDHGKEFFTVEIAELEAFAQERGLPVAFTHVPEAREYRESVAARMTQSSRDRSGRKDTFPPAIAATP